MHFKAVGLLAAAGLVAAAPPAYSPAPPPETTTPAPSPPPPETTKPVEPTTYEAPKPAEPTTYEAPKPAEPTTEAPEPSAPSSYGGHGWGSSTWGAGKPVATVAGKAFDRILQIYLETTSFDNATAEPNCQKIYEQGILLTQNYGVGAPSQPAYVAAASGDYYGTNSDSYIEVAANVSTIVDLLDAGGISWTDYNQALPYSGFDGFNYTSTEGGYDNGTYVRKHNLLQRFLSIQNNATRESLVQNLTQFYDQLEAETLPQWMFLTPNLYNDGHDTNVTVSCGFVLDFITPLLENDYFNNNTLIYITWQANGDDGTARNHVAGIQVGSAVPDHLIGTQDDAYYNHYSELSSVEANWGLHTLGRWDVGANVWSWVGEKTGDVIREFQGDFESYYWNQSYGGVFSSAKSTSHLYPSPNIELVHNGRTVLQSIIDTWKGSQLPDYYKDIIEVPDEFHPPPGYGVPIGLAPPEPITTPITEYPSSLRSDTNPTEAAKK